ncbi:class I SAM-dependent methyltransferase [Arhodomonas aquaeolei]|uniref:class I SAM-dependent methyltransferase n=1 Tax=Arhodomonas aquaeolei TaxID=2369 RepID=UPI0009FD5608|nr:class I SAM-dependent methyltransferase [Arhodomonas aquaeolei]
MSWLTAWLDRVLYPGYGSNWDDNLFRERVLDRLTGGSVVLDLGAGAGIVPQMNFRGHAKHVVGVDLDERVLENPYLDEGCVADVGDIPFAKESFDLVFADNVMEHLDQPSDVFREVARVLKPGGMLLFKTPNRIHYMPMIARLTPHSFHRAINRVRGRDGDDTFPTRYYANSMKQVRRLALDTGFKVERIDRVEGRPEYLRGTVPSYLAGAGYERIVNATELFAPLRILLIAELRKN